MAGLLFGPGRALLGGLSKIFKFDPLLTTFTPGMDKRAAPGPFATAPIVQGNFADSAEVGDTVNLGRGSQIVADYFYETQDTYQGSMSFWITPEWDWTEEESRYIFGQWGAGVYLETHGGVGWRELKLGHGASGINLVSTTIFGWTAGTTYHVVCRWDIKNTLDGTNHACISINGVHTFGRSSTWVNSAPPANVSFGASWNDTLGINAIIEGFTVYRRPLFDGQYGIAANWDDSGPVDEIEEIYAAGSGADPCLITGSWDIVFCLPTNSTVEELVTGTGEAWSHPHSSGVLEHQWLEDRGYLGDAWAVKGNGSNTEINFGSGASLDDVPAGAQITIEFWAKIAPDVGDWDFFLWKGAGSVGWRVNMNNGDDIAVNFYTDATSAGAESQNTVNDGKWHHYAITYNDAVGRTPIIWIDGKQIAVWDTTATGTYVSDAGNDLKAFTGGFTDLMGWIRISDNIRYSAEFIPPRTMPVADGNTVEQWAMNEGTGATITASVTSPGNDGTLTNGTWEEQWDQETSPIVPYSLKVTDGDDPEIDFGSGANIDDLHAGNMTVDIWFRPDSVGQGSNGFLVSKSSGAGSTDGWNISINASGQVSVRINCATTDARVWSSGSSISNSYKKWRNLRLTYDGGGGRKTPRIWLDGIEDSAAQTSGVGAEVSDAAQDLLVANRGDSIRDFDGAIGWIAVSNSIRGTADFTPNGRENPPTNDANYHLLVNMNEGAGTTAADSSGNAYDGTISNSTWLITPDMEIDSPGERIFNWGYVIGNDAVDEGIVETLSGLDAGQNYVVRTVASIESASRGRPKIIIYDETNGAEITSLEGPSYTGVHDGLANAATLTDTTARFPQMLVGWTIYNITDLSSATITAISGDMQIITGALSGGTDDDWDIGDEYRIVPPGGPAFYDDYPWIETFTFELPTIARNGAAADCVSISVKLVNGVNEGVIKWHQIELLENLLDNPSLETGAGNPWIPDGWSNNGLDAGDTVAEAVILHSGVGSMEWNTGAIAGEQIYDTTFGFGGGEYFSMGAWMYGDGAITLKVGGQSAGEAVVQSNPALYNISGEIATVWNHQPVVVRAPAPSPIDFGIEAESAASGDRFLDDVYCFQCDDVSLTVTPASEANSAESGGLRVDGRDLCTQPIPAGILADTAGWIKWKWIPRHDAANIHDFGSGDARIIHFVFDGTRYIYLHASANNTIQLRFNDGGGIASINWDCTGLIVAGTEYAMQIKYNAAEMILIVDGVTRATVVSPIDFAGSVPNMAYWGHRSNGDRQFDSVFKAP